MTRAQGGDEGLFYFQASTPTGHLHASLCTANPAVERAFRRTMRAQGLDVRMWPVEVVLACRSAGAALPDPEGPAPPGSPALPFPGPHASPAPHQDVIHDPTDPARP